MSPTERISSVYNWFKLREQELTKAAVSNSGRLPRHDAWRYSYYQEPYLLLEPDEVVLARFGDIVSNDYDITAEGKIALLPVLSKGIGFMQLFTEILEETNWRGILTVGAADESRRQLNTYFQDDVPLSVTMFRDKIDVAPGRLFKFSKSEYVSDMYKFGRIRISPASDYSKGSHIRAARDLETKRTYKLKAIKEAMDGADTISVGGQKLPIVNGVVRVEVLMEDYYLFCTCKDVSRRMPMDFEADAVLVITDKSEFISRLRNALLNQQTSWEFLEGEVEYFDPYNYVPKSANQEFTKHMSYAYQKEHRCILRRRGREPEYDALSPFFVELGSLEDISEVILSPERP